MNKPSQVGTKTSGTSPAAFNPSDLLAIDEVARRLHADIEWVRAKVRRRSPNPMPVYNLGRHLLFSWPEVCEWIRHSPRPVHAPHIRRRRKSD